MKSIKSKIVLNVVSIVIALCVVLGLAGSISNFLTAQSVLRKNMETTAFLAGKYIEKELSNVRQIAAESGTIEKLSDPKVPLKEKEAILEIKKETYGYLGANLLDEKGISLLDGNDYSERNYFQASMNGEAFISGPLVSKLTGEYSIIISAPLWKDGIPDTEVVGVVYFKPDLYILSDIVAEIPVGETGGVYIIDKEGLCVAYPERERVCVEKTVEDVKEDPTLTKLAEIEQKMIDQESGFSSYRYEGGKWIQAYAPISNTEGWSVGVFALEEEFMGNVKLSILITIVLALLFLLVGYFVSRASAARISQPIMKCIKRIEQLSQGDLTTAVPDIKTKDETAKLAKSTENLVEQLGGVVQDISYVLGEMSTGNLNVKSAGNYVGDFIPIQNATSKIITSLNDTMYQIRVSAEQVESGSEQVSDGAQALAQSSTQQASTTQELAATVNEVAEQVKNTADSAKRADAQSKQASGEVENCNHQMQSLITAMSDIREASGQINKIIKNIEDIAEQTNMLSLNASIEAARAGEAGKGFAVVAGEVGSLAADSSTAAKNTSDLIAATIQAVDKGMNIVDKTAKALEAVVYDTNAVGEVIQEISEATSAQSHSIDQIMQALGQITDVVQTNSATAEESSAASEELQAQADVLRSQIGLFQLNK